jgi:hypothetical protein
MLSARGGLGGNVVGDVHALGWCSVARRHAARTWPRSERFMIFTLAHVWVRFYAELNDHLAPDQRYRTLETEFFVPASVKDLIESFGIPHTEVELVLVNGESSDFSRLVRWGSCRAVSRIRIAGYHSGAARTPATAARTEVRAGCPFGTAGSLSTHARIRY